MLAECHDIQTIRLQSIQVNVDRTADLLLHTFVLLLDID